MGAAAPSPPAARRQNCEPTAVVAAPLSRGASSSPDGRIWQSTEGIEPPRRGSAPSGERATTARDLVPRRSPKKTGRTCLASSTAQPIARMDRSAGLRPSGSRGADRCAAQTRTAPQASPSPSPPTARAPVSPSTAQLVLLGPLAHGHDEQGTPPAQHSPDAAKNRSLLRRTRPRLAAHLRPRAPRPAHVVAAVRQTASTIVPAPPETHSSRPAPRPGATCSPQADARRY